MALVDDATRTQLRERLSRSLVGAVELRLYRKPGGGRLVSVLHLARVSAEGITHGGDMA